MIQPPNTHHIWSWSGKQLLFSKWFAVFSSQPYLIQYYHFFFFFSFHTLEKLILFLISHQAALAIVIGWRFSSHLCCVCYAVPTHSIHFPSTPLFWISAKNPNQIIYRSTLVDCFSMCTVFTVQCSVCEHFLFGAFFLFPISRKASSFSFANVAVALNSIASTKTMLLQLVYNLQSNTTASVCVCVFLFVVAFNAC